MNGLLSPEVGFRPAYLLYRRAAKAKGKKFTLKKKVITNALCHLRIDVYKVFIRKERKTSFPQLEVRLTVPVNLRGGAH